MLQYLLMQQLFGGADVPDRAPPRPTQPVPRVMHPTRFQEQRTRPTMQMHEPRAGRHVPRTQGRNIHRQSQFRVTQPQVGQPHSTFRKQRPNDVRFRNALRGTVTRSGGRAAPGLPQHTGVLHRSNKPPPPRPHSNQGQGPEPAEAERQGQGQTHGSSQTSGTGVPSSTWHGMVQGSPSSSQGQTPETAESEAQAQTTRRSKQRTGPRKPPSSRLVKSQTQIGPRRTAVNRKVYPTTQSGSSPRVVPSPQGQFGSPEFNQISQSPRNQFGSRTRTHAQTGPRHYDPQFRQPHHSQPRPQTIYQSALQTRQRDQYHSPPDSHSGRNIYGSLEHGPLRNSPQNPQGKRRRQQPRHVGVIQRRRQRVQTHGPPMPAIDSGYVADRRADRADLMADQMDNLQAMSPLERMLRQANPLRAGMQGVGMSHAGFGNLTPGNLLNAFPGMGFL